MEEHARDLREEVRDREGAQALVDAMKTDYRRAELEPADRAMLDFAAKLTRRPEAMEERDVEALRKAGFTDTAIHDVVQVAALFNYYNRLADGLGIAMEEL